MGHKFLILILAFVLTSCDVNKHLRQRTFASSETMMTDSLVSTSSSLMRAIHNHETTDSTLHHEDISVVVIDFDTSTPPDTLGRHPIKRVTTYNATTRNITTYTTNAVDSVTVADTTSIRTFTEVRQNNNTLTNVEAEVKKRVPWIGGILIIIVIIVVIAIIKRL